MLKYTSPKIKIITFDKEDIIQTSGLTNNGSAAPIAGDSTLITLSPQTSKTSNFNLFE